MLRGKLKFIIAIIVIASTVNELKSKVPGVYGETVRVSGKVVPGSIKHGSDGSLEFSLADDGGDIAVAYSGIVPDIFKDNVEAVVEGNYTDRNVFMANVLLAKCPTKYESTEALYQKGPGIKGVNTY